MFDLLKCLCVRAHVCWQALDEGDFSSSPDEGLGHSGLLVREALFSLIPKE